jgi:glycerophosphoryl diester phosphodiesterase
MLGTFDLQGHRGARGRKPENTLPSIEVALDSGVTSIETDIHLSRDGVPVLYHDAFLSDQLCRALRGRRVPDLAQRPRVRDLSLRQLYSYAADRNPDPERFPEQDAAPTPLARRYARQHARHPYSLPALSDLFAFAAAYAGEWGATAGKTPEQQARARAVRFDLELKRVPFSPEIIGDAFDGKGLGLLEKSILAAARSAGVLGRIAVRSFDHRCVRALTRHKPALAAGVLIAETAPVSPVRLVREAGASTYCPAYEYLDREQVRQCQAEGIRVVPWTVNDLEAWRRLLDWGVDGITTDFPDRLAALIRHEGIAF